MNLNKTIIASIAALLGAISSASAAPCCAVPCETTTGECPMMQTTSGQPSEALQALVASYEKLANALFDAKLPVIQAAAYELSAKATEHGKTALSVKAKELASASSPNAARAAFSPLSAEMIAIVGDEPGYYVMVCPMVKNGQWLQTSRELHNPYMGESMPRCGFIKRATGEK